MVNLTSVFPWLSIRNKLLIAFAGLSIFPVALVGIYDIISNVNSTREIAFTKLTQDVSTIREKSENFLTNVDTDLRLLSNSSAFRRFIETTDPLTPGATREQTFAEVLSFVRTKGTYYQIRLVNYEGDELLRIEDADPNGSTRRYQIVPNDELRSSNAAYYFLLTRDLKPDQIAFAPAELVGPAGTRVPVISFAMPINNHSGRAGILIANVFAQDLFRVLESSQGTMNGNVVLVSSDGYYLFHSKKKNAWNRLLASREEDNLRRDYPANVVTQISSGKAGIADTGEEIISYAPLFIGDSTDPARQISNGLAIPLYVFEAVPKDLILGPIHSLARNFAGLLAFFLAAAIGLGLLATRQFTRPIAEMQHGAEIIAKGNYDHRLSIETRDEIEQLAEQFNRMAGALEAREKEIQLHRATLERAVQERTRELMEEKAKLQAVLDNVPSAFVLIDNEFRIRSASAAFSQITGRRLDDVRGRDCHQVLCQGGFCHTCLCEQVLLSGNTATHIDEVVADNGYPQFIEHVAIAMKENGENTSILEIITDVTQRKRLEQNLVRTERLMAAGEMSAIIAHEFRNALTSIKMILQLQKELQQLSRADKKSLGVALKSLYHMEDIVTELLNFGRPSPMNFHMHDLNTIIAEGLSFIRIQMGAENIKLVTSIDDSIPAMRLDASHLKEAIINVVLNAIQAIRSKEEPKAKETITVVAKGIVLNRTLHDFGLVSSVGNPSCQSELQDEEIVLSKGTGCVLVEISDTGPGIEKRILDRIFDPFFTTKTNGTGLGLPMVKRTVNAHGGIVTAKSSRSKGTIFRIYLPVENGRTP